MLKEVAGLSGVGELIGYQESKATEDAGCCGYNTICGIRGYGLGNTHPLHEMPKKKLDVTVKLSNRIRCRLLIVKYDGDISSAPNPISLLRAFRDAVAGKCPDQ